MNVCIDDDVVVLRPCYSMVLLPNIYQ
jgi:hypothetical protein